MKKIILATLVFVCGCFVGARHPRIVPVAHAQVDSPAYTCDFGQSGNTNAYPCAQYLIAVAPQRLGGGVIIWKVTDTPFAVNGATNLSAIGSGSLAGTSVQVFVPGSTTQTLTLSESQP